MPWHLSDSQSDCSGWAVVLDATGETVGCHDTKAKAQKHLAALNINAKSLEPSEDKTMELPRENLVRTLPERAEMRADGTGGMPTIFGHFARFNEWNLISSMSEGTFLERIAPGAFKKTFKENRDNMRLLFQHGKDPVAGDKPIATLTMLREDPEGPYYEGQLLDAGYVRDILPGLQAGVYGASYRFSVMREDVNTDPGVSDHNPEGLPERTIKEARVYEAGPVTWGADPMATAAVRSLTDWYRDTKTSPHATKSPEATPTPAAVAVTSDKVEEPKEVQVSVDIDRFTSMELLVARRQEIDERRQYLNAEFAGKQFSEDVQHEWDELGQEQEAITARVEHLQAREEAIAKAAKQPKRTETVVPVERGFNTPKNTIENIYDLHSHRAAASSPEHETRLLRDSMKRSIETTTFAHPAAKREYAQEAVSSTVEKLDRGGNLAAYLLSVGSPTYREAFGKWATSGGIAPLDSGMSRAIEQAKAYEERAFTLGSTGLPVPYQLDPTIIPISNWSVNPFRAIARVEQTVVNQWRGATSAGITAAYATEAAEASDNTPTLAQPTIDAARAQAFVPFSIEVQQDWGVIEAEMAREIQDAKDDLEATKFTSGSGTNEPAGLITGATTTVSTTTTGTFVIADLYKMEEALPPRFRPRASIVGNRFVFNKVRQFDTSGGSGVWLDGLQPGLANQVPSPGAIGPRILGYPAYEDSAMDAVLTTGSKILVIGDYRYFVIVDRVGMSVDLLPHLVSTNHRPTGQRGLYAFWRNGSKVVNAAAFRTLLT